MNSNLQHHRIFGLDLLRAIAILLVVLSHGKFFLQNTPLQGFPFFSWIDGVDIFFVLSGYLIGGILLNTLSGSSPPSSKELIHFWKRRWFRTLPNYYLILLVNYLFVSYGIIGGDIQQFNYHFITFTQNFTSPFFDFFWESWSLSVEEWFYIIAPVVCWIFVRKLPVKKAFLLVTLLMITVPLLYRISQFNPNISDFHWDVNLRKTVLSRLDSIGFGLLAAWCHRYYATLWIRLKSPLLLVGVFGMYLAVYIGVPVSSWYKQTWYFTLIPATVFLTIPWLSLYTPTTNWIRRRLTHVSKISYSMYLINLGCVAQVISHQASPLGNWDGIFKYGLYWIAVLVTSSLLYKYYEKPVMQLRDHRIFNR